MDDVRQEYIDAIKEDKSYDWIANNYYRMTKEELKDIILETLYAIHAIAYLGDEQIILEQSQYDLIERWGGEVE